MTRIQRRIFKQGLIVGLVLTIVVIAADLAGLLAVPEDLLYDLRARYFQHFTPKPTDQLVHVDIDDRALEQIGAWPWPRAKIAQMLDEMRLAGVKAVAIDVLFTEPQPRQPIIAQQSDGSSTFQGMLDNDAELAAAVGRLGNVVIPASLTFEPPVHSAVYLKLVELLTENPELNESELSLAPELQQRVNDAFLVARREALFQRIAREMRDPPSPEELRRRVLKSQQPDVSSPVSRAFDDQYARWESQEAIKRSSAPSVVFSVGPIHTDANLVPLPELARSAAGSAFVDFTTDRDGVLRSVPLLVELDGCLVPQMGLSLVLRTVGVQAKDVKITENTITIPASPLPIVIPVERQYVGEQGRQVAFMFNLPWFGGARWEDMYDWPDHRQIKQHVPMTLIWDACDIRGKIARNNENALVALKEFVEIFGLKPDLARPSSRPTDDPDALTKQIEQAMSEAAAFTEPILAAPPQDLNDDARLVLKRLSILRNAREQNRLLTDQLRQQRVLVAEQLSGKSALIGFTATGLHDVTPTSLHPRCPGVIAHGVVFNSIMTGEFWRTPPVWVTIGFTLVVGLVTSLSAGLIPPLRGLLVTLLIGLVFFLFNGIVLFDRGNLLVGLAGPMTACLTAWAGCTLSRIAIESAERTRITRRFGTYLDPKLVSHLLDNPDQVRFEGEKRVLTVVFTDLAGFTTLSEKLGERTIPLLNDYMGRMVPIIRNHQGYVNKFLGDGIMFFFGAPIPGADHAACAVETVLEMQTAMQVFNEELSRRELPTIKMRAGISTGEMVVGDAGSGDPSDYTVLGDTVNLGARLESANKAVGTSVLMNDRTAELLNGKFLLRPIGKLQVVGKNESVMTYEVIGTVAAATDQQKHLVQKTTDVVNAFVERRFADCLAAIDGLEFEMGSSPLTRLYREQSEHFLQHPPDDSFDGRIKLAEK